MKCEEQQKKGFMQLAQGLNYSLEGNCSLAYDGPAANLKVAVEIGNRKEIYPQI